MRLRDERVCEIVSSTTFKIDLSVPCNVIGAVLMCAKRPHCEEVTTMYSGACRVSFLGERPGRS